MILMLSVEAMGFRSLIVDAVHLAFHGFGHLHLHKFPVVILSAVGVFDKCIETRKLQLDVLGLVGVS